MSAQGSDGAASRSTTPIVNLDVRQATRLALDAARPLAPMEMALSQTQNCLVATDIAWPTDIPRAPLAAYDGYAVRSADLAGGRDTLRVIAHVRPGDADPAHVVEGSAVRVHSGVPLPAGADAVVPSSATDLGGVTVTVADAGAFAAGTGVAAAGSQGAAGKVAVSAGTRLTPRHLALLADIGLGRVLVHPLPRVALLSVGDEIVDVAERANAAQRWDATGVGLGALLRELGAAPFRVVGVPDAITEIREAVDDQVVRADVVVLTGGLSDTSRDVVPEALAGIADFQLIRASTLPEMVFGVGWLAEGLHSRPVFALPGDPARALIAAEAFLRPALRAMMGAAKRGRPTVLARISEGWDSPQGVREFLGVRVSGSGDEQDPYVAKVVAPSHALTPAGLTASNALGVIPEDVTRVAPGRLVACALLDE